MKQIRTNSGARGKKRVPPVAGEGRRAAVGVIGLGKEPMTRTTVILDAAEVDAKPWRSVMEWPGVQGKGLWRDGESYAGLLRVDPETKIPSHKHPLAVHHMWVVEGDFRLNGKSFGPGSYCFVPAESDHEVEAGKNGCTSFYLFLAAGVARIG